MLVGDSSALRVLGPRGLKKNTTQMTNSQQGVFNPITAGLQRQRLRHVDITQGRHIRSPVKLKKKKPPKPPSVSGEKWISQNH